MLSMEFRIIKKGVGIEICMTSGRQQAVFYMKHNMT